MDTTETILLEICRSLLKEIGGSDRVETEKYDALGDTPVTFVTFGAIKYPTGGKTRIESLGWMVAQALAQPGLNEQLVTKVHGLLMQHGITIPTREEYEKAMERMPDGCKL